MENKMKVFAIPLEKNGKEYRLKTLLQFGDSTELIGSAVLMNPGSSTKLQKADIAESEAIKTFFRNNHNIENIDDWYKYSIDSTMRYLEKLFNGWYILPKGNKTELNGIIQLFNCFYYKTPNRNDAQNEYENITFQKDEHQLIASKPVYFGWGNFLDDVAVQIFNEYMKEDTIYTQFYHQEFGKNKFYHPGFVNRGYNRYAHLMQDNLTKFFELVHK